MTAFCKIISPIARIENWKASGMPCFKCSKVKDQDVLKSDNFNLKNLYLINV